jgi:hypothetical protein
VDGAEVSRAEARKVKVSKDEISRILSAGPMLVGTRSAGPTSAMFHVSNVQVSRDEVSMT